MKIDDIGDLLEKYHKGTSTLENEEKLMRKIRDGGDDLTPWSKFIDHQQIEVPSNLESLSWQAIVADRVKIRKRIWYCGVAAVVAILVGSFFILEDRTEQGLEVKEALLQEAFSMLGTSEDVSVPDEVLYEDELVIIYK